MKLTRGQLDYIKTQRERFVQREKDIRSIGDDIYKSDTLCRELSQMAMENQFFNHMIKLHNIAVKEESNKAW